jgi:hypothetical protein
MSAKNTLTSRTDNERDVKEQSVPRRAQETANNADLSERRPQSRENIGAGNSEALKEILEKAQLLFGPLAQQTGMSAPQEAPAAENQSDVINPFPDAFPSVHWRRVSYPGTSRYYLEGETQDRTGKYLLHAIPGEYAPVPPVHGFRRFLRATDGRGYWIRIRKVGT